MSDSTIRVGIADLPQGKTGQRSSYACRIPLAIACRRG